MDPEDIRELQLAKDALAASETRLRLVLQGANDGWWDWDLRAGELFYSPRWWSMLGYQPDELPNDDALWRRLMHPDDGAEVERVFGVALQQRGTQYEVEFRLRHKDGHYVPILSRGHIERDAAGTAVRVSGSNTDMTARRRDEAALRESEAGQAALFGAMVDGVFVAQHHRFVFSNPALPAMLGYAPGEFVGLGFAEVVHPDFLALWTGRFEQRVAPGEEPLRHYEVRFLCKGGQASIWLELRANRFQFHGEPAVLGIVRDITERKHAEAALTAAQQLAQATLDSLGAHICVLDARGGVVSVNSAWRDFAGIPGAARPRGVGLGDDYLALCVAAAQAGSLEAGRFEAGLRAVLDGQRPRFEMVYPASGSSGLRWFLVRATPCRGDGPLRVVVAHEDITEQIEAEHRIAHLNERFALAIRGAGCGVWEFVLDSRTLIWDEQMHAIYGHTPESFGRTRDAVRACVHPDDRSIVDARFADMMAGRRVDHFVFRVRRASDGELRHVEGSGYLQRAQDGTPQRLVGMNRDITATVRAAVALRESEERWKFAIEGAGDGVWDWDVPTDEISYSRRWKAMLGHTEDEIGTGFEEWRSRVHPDDRAAAQTALQDYLDGRAPAFAAEHRLRCKDGSWKWVHSRGLVVSRDAAGRPLRVVGTHTDLSEQKHAEATRAELETRLREAQKMEAIGTLAGGVAHDFNNVLAGILGNVALAKQDVGPQHAALASLAQIDKAALRARNLVQQILAFSRRQPQALVAQPLGPLVEEALALLRVTVPASVRIEPRLTAQPLHVMADATQMQQVLMNLCTNAWHALQGSPGRIVVGLEAVRFGPGAAPAPPGLAPGRYAHLWVGDDGCGMDAAALARIFEPFYTTKPVGQGTGLGLAVVHGIVAAHGGAIVVDSRVGQGSSFHLHLPLLAAPVIATPDPLQLPAAVGGHGEHVVYIDDDEIMVLTVERLLQRAGYRVSCHADGSAALAALAAADDPPDLVVTDFNMPGLSGIDVARELARRWPALPVVISSGYISEELRAEALAVGVRSLLNKENTVEELRVLVHQVLATVVA